MWAISIDNAAASKHKSIEHASIFILWIKVLIFTRSFFPLNFCEAQNPMNFMLHQIELNICEI